LQIIRILLIDLQVQSMLHKRRRFMKNLERNWRKLKAQINPDI
jgi:hypothetical protein